MSSKNKATNSEAKESIKKTVGDTDAKVCIVCGKNSNRTVTNDKYPKRFICLSCFNGFVFSLKTLEEEIEPLLDELTKRLDTLDQDMNKK
jgi:hypothetical protein